MRIPRMLKHGRLWFTGPLAVLIVATAGIPGGIGSADGAVSERHPGGSSGLAARPLRSKPVVYDTAEGQKSASSW